MLKLSIIIPVFGVEKHISRCLDSVFSIGLRDEEFEVICVDDCTKDASVQIIEEYETRHDNLILLHHPENKKQGGARNTGIGHAKGKYVIFVDADDRVPSYDINSLLTYMTEHDLELLLGAADVISSKGNVKRWGNAPSVESPIMSGPEIFTGGYVHKIAYGVVWMGIYSLELIKRLPPFVEKVFFEDTDWTLRCAYEARKLQYKPIVIYNYIENEGSTTKKGTVSKLIERAQQGLRIWNWGQKTVENHEEVMIAVEDYCTWNMQAFKSLLLFGRDERSQFFNAFTEEEIATMLQWSANSKWKFFAKHPHSVRAFLFLVSPIARIGKKMKTVFYN